MLRAGFTLVLVTGMLTRWMSVRHSPMAMGAKPAGALREVAPRITNRKKKVMTASVRKAEPREYCPGLWGPYPLLANPPGWKNGLPEAMR